MYIVVFDDKWAYRYHLSAIEMYRKYNILLNYKL